MKKRNTPVFAELMLIHKPQCKKFACKMLD